MAIVRWEPFGRNMIPWQGFNSLRRRMDSLFDEFTRGDSEEVSQSSWLPSVDVTENEVTTCNWFCDPSDDLTTYLNVLTPLWCYNYSAETWVFDIADFVDVLWKSKTSGAYVVQLRFYPR